MGVIFILTFLDDICYEIYKQPLIKSSRIQTISSFIEAFFTIFMCQNFHSFLVEVWKADIVRIHSNLHTNIISSKGRNANSTIQSSNLEKLENRFPLVLGRSYLLYVPN